MSTYINKVNEIVGLLLEAEEQEVNLQVILDSDLAYDVAKELQYTFEKDFCMDSEDEFEIDLNENDILGVAVSIYEDGEVEYFLQPVMNDDGEMYGDEASDIVFVQDEIVDCLYLDEFDCEVVVLEEMDDNEDELDDLFEELTSELLEDIEENQDDEDFCLHCTIKDAIIEAYEIGLHDGLNSEE